MEAIINEIIWEQMQVQHDITDELKEKNFFGMGMFEVWQRRDYQRRCKDGHPF